MPSAARKGKGRAEASAPKTEAALPLGKQLAHTDKSVRDQAMRNLVAFLSRGAGEGAEGSVYVRLSDEEMAKLWKGLFYCFWMSDKPLVQQALATDLSSLLLRIDPAPSAADLSPAAREAERFAASLAFLEGFWAAMIREWNGIDRLRMDKYLMLLRRWTHATLRLLARSRWSPDAVRAVNAVYSAPSGPLSWRDPRVPASIATHLADVFLDELDRVLSSPHPSPSPDAPSDPSPAAPAPCPLPLLLEPYTQLLARTPSSRTHDRLMLALFRPLLAALAPPAPPAPETDRPAKRRKPEPAPAPEAKYAGVAAHCRALPATGDAAADAPAGVRRAVLGAMFAAAADAGAVESNRRKVYKVWREEGGDDDDDDA